MLGRKKLVVGCLGSLVLLVFAVLVVIPWALRAALRSRYTPEKLAAVERAYEPPQVPASWAEVQPWSPELMQAMDKLSEEWEKAKFTASPTVDFAIATSLCHGRDDLSSLSEDDWSTVSQLVQHYNGFLNALQAVAEIPDYNSGVLDFPDAAVRSREIPS